MKILELKNKIMEIKNSTDCLKATKYSQNYEASTEIRKKQSKSGERKEGLEIQKEKNRNVTYLWAVVIRVNICKIGLPEEESKKVGQKQNGSR